MGGPRTTFEFTKICAKCRRERPHSAFPSAGVRGLDSYCTSCSAIVKRERYRKNPAPYLKNARRQNAKLKAQALQAYGGSCRCCGEDNPVFLAIDHIHGGGGAHRKTVGSGLEMYRWLKNNRFPDGLAVLCHNCNWAKYVTGDCCPHKQPNWMPPAWGGGSFVCAIA